MGTASDLSDKLNKDLENIKNNALESRYLSEIASKLGVVRDAYNQELNDAESAQQVQWLMDVLNFRIKDGVLRPMLSGTKDDGSPWEYPILDDFTEQGFAFIERELQYTSSPVLKARYAHLLWLAKGDHKNARAAIDEYIKLISIFEDKDKANPEGHFGLDVLNTIKNCFRLGRKINYKKAETKQELERLLYDYNHESTSANKLRIDLIELAYANKKEFDNKFWKKVVKICRESAKSLIKNGNWFFGRNFLVLAQKIDNQILKNNTTKWDEEIAKSFEKEASAHRKTGNFAELDALVKAIQIYQKLKNKEKVALLKKQYEKSAKNMKFTKFKQTIDISEFAEKFRKQVQEIAKEEPEEILKLLVTDTYLLLSYEEIKKEVANQKEEYPLQHLFGQVIFDHNMNMVKKADSDGEKEFSSIIRQYTLYMQTTYSTKIIILFEELLKSEKLTLDNLIDFFKDNSWFGKQYSIKNDEGEVVLTTYKWLDLLEPALGSYFQETQKAIRAAEEGQDYYPNLVLIIDSLVVKFEGLIREIYKLLGEPTIVIRNDKGGKTLTFEKDLNNYLTEPFIKEIFGQDLVLLMRYVLVEQAGFNLRNNVGHCLMQKENYHLLEAHLLILILLRLGNLEFEPVINSKDD